MGAQRQGTLLVGDPDAPQVALGRGSAGRVWWWVRRPGRPRDREGSPAGRLRNPPEWGGLLADGEVATLPDPRRGQ